VVRIFVPAGGEEITLCGTVEHVGSGRVDTFEGADRLLGLVTAGLSGRVVPTRTEMHDDGG